MMADVRSLASLVILTDSIEVLRKCVSSGRVTKLATEGSSSKKESAKLSPEKGIASNLESVEISKLSSKSISIDSSGEISKLSPDECIPSNFLTFELFEDITTINQLPYYSTETCSEMKMPEIRDESNLSKEPLGDQIPFENEQNKDSLEDGFASFRLNENMPLITYSKLQAKMNNTQFDQLKLLSNMKSYNDLSNLKERKRYVTEDHSSSYRNNDSENALCSPLNIPKKELNQKLIKKAVGKKISKSLVENSERISTNVKTDSVINQPTESGFKISSRKRLRGRPCRKKSTRNFTIKD